jgi:cell division protein ZapE
MKIRFAYQALLENEGMLVDSAQEEVVRRLAQLQQTIVDQNAPFQRLRRRLPRGSEASPRGIYLWGGVGRGKTFLMDLFFSTLDYQPKKRIHFHRMMSNVHSRLHEIANTGAIENPLEQVAADIAKDAQVLCFDEFFVSDIGDAMILGRLLDAFFRHGVTLVTTSNSHPSALYPDGLQRQRFLPAIDALLQHTEVIELDAGTDYRLRLFARAGTYLVSPGDAADKELNGYFAGIASGDVREAHDIEVLGRSIRTKRCGKGVVWFDFMEICDGPRSQEDYIEIARWYPTVIISDVPVLTAELENAARRFVALVDEFYDRKVKLVLSAAAPAESLYQGKRLEFEFQRTSSRLTEMQQEKYLHAAHIA